MNTYIYSTILSTVAVYSSSYIFKYAVESMTTTIINKTIDVVKNNININKNNSGIEFEILNENSIKNDEQIIVNNKSSDYDFIFIDENGNEYTLDDLKEQDEKTKKKSLETPSYKPIQNYSLKIMKSELDKDNFILNRLKKYNSD